jgi:hypothetical protein
MTQSKYGMVMEIRDGKARVKFGPLVTDCEWVAAIGLRPDDPVKLTWVSTASGGWWTAEKAQKPGGIDLTNL